ncbi:MAG: 6,7-dimethyl-8-ribityllumazine synthase 1 [Pseudomonadota bacterium]
MAGPKSGMALDGLKVQAHILIIEGRFHTKIIDDLADGAAAVLKEAGATYERVPVPGALEIPQVLEHAIAAGLVGRDPAAPRFDGAIALGCVIRGETTHYETVCNNANHWLMDVAIRNAVPVGNAILTVETEAQAIARSKPGPDNKGADAARACLMLIAHARTFAMAADAATHASEAGSGELVA